jgi:DNA-binding SARP family transcriptional activator
LDCRLLGPVGVIVDGVPVRIDRRRVRHLLALLLLDVGRPVPTLRLIDLLWPDEPPPNAHAALQTTVSRLRSALGGIEGIAVVRRGDTYAIEADHEVVDAYRFRGLVERAALAPDAATRSALASRALALWRGLALADVGTDTSRAATCAGLDKDP